MIVARIYNNGLGNQLFQYAAARSLADKNQDVLALDLREFSSFRLKEKVGSIPFLRSPLLDGSTSRNYALDAFNIRASVAHSLGLVARGFLTTRRIRKYLIGLRLLRGHFIPERSFTYVPFKADPTQFTYLEGRWQSWRYFDGNRERLLRDLSLKKGPDRRNEAVLKDIQKGDSVCLHVRLGDYTNPVGAAHGFGALSRDYYRKAIGKLGRGLRRPRYFLFSDEPHKAVQLLQLGSRVTVVDHNSAAPLEDLRLMRACKNFIIANSTFSWWGAWLCEHPRKKVIAPKAWFTDSREDTKDLIPPGWVRL